MNRPISRKKQQKKIFITDIKIKLEKDQGKADIAETQQRSNKDKDKSQMKWK